MKEQRSPAGHTMQQLEHRCLQDAFVAPQWLPDGNSFWYRRQTSPDKFEFVFVDILNKSIRPAFDHEQLAAELSKQSEAEIDPTALPFTWIEVDSANTLLVYFRFQQKKWKYGAKEGLSVWDGQFAKRNSSFIRKEKPSAAIERSNISISFTNHTRVNLSIRYINWNGEPLAMGWVPSGETRRQKSKPGHVWRLESTVSAKEKAVYQVPIVGTDDVIVEERDIDPCWSDEDDEDDDQHDSGKEVDKKDVPSIENGNKNGERVSLFVSKDGLEMRDEKGDTIQLASGGNEALSYDEIMLLKSPDDKFAIAWQFTDDEETYLPLLNYTPSDQIEPKIKQRYSKKAGDNIREDRPRLFNLSTKCEVPTSNELFSKPLALNNLGWSKSGEEYRFIYNERGHQCARVLGIKRDGSVSVLFEEKTNTFIDYTSKMYYHLVKDNETDLERLIWASEKDGHNHLYMIDLKHGGVMNQITSGDWNVNRVDRIDEKAGHLWVSTYGFRKDEDPYHQHLVRVKFDGTGCQVLTEGDGSHSWDWSPDKRFIIDKWSRVDLPPQAAVRCAQTGELKLMLCQKSVEDLKEKGWSPPERFAALGRDGETSVYGVIIQPPNADSTKIYPVLEYIYNGGQDFHTPKRFGQATILHYWAAQGFVVVQVDGMGTNWRSKKFHNVCWKNTKDAGFLDRIPWIKEAARTRPMDLSRVGILGVSCGGTNAVSGMLHHGDFYKVAVADSGGHDPLVDKISWNEQYLGYPVDDSYMENSNLTHAAKLQGKLMLVVGGMDTFVHPAGTMKMAKRLNEEDKDYDLIFIPDGGHGCSSDGYGLRRSTDFLKKHLLGV